MSLKSGQIGGIEFWDSVSATFAANDHVFYELYNEPHMEDSQLDIFIHGDETYAGMLELEAAVRANVPDAVLIIAGMKQWAYDSASLIELDSLLTGQNAIYNYHAYMGPKQQHKANQSAEGFDQIIKQVQAGTDKATIMTEFGQFCCATDGECY